MLQKGRFLVYQVPHACYLRHAGSWWPQWLPAPAHPPLRATTREISQETRRCRGCTKCPLRAHVNSMFYKPLNFGNTASASVCLLESDILGNFQHFWLLAPFTKRGHLILGLLLSHCLAEPQKNFHLTSLQLKKDIYVIQKVKVTCHLANAHTTDSDSNVAMLQGGFIRLLTNRREQRNWNASETLC